VSISDLIPDKFIKRSFSMGETAKSKFCGKCGAELGGAKFCIKCGTPAASDVDSRAEEHFNQGEKYIDLYQYGKAVKEFTKAIEIEPKYAEAYYGRGRAYTGKRGFSWEKKAHSDFSEAIRLNPDYAEAYFTRGMILPFGKERIADLTDAIRLNPNDAEAYFQRGYAYHSLGNFSGAIPDYEAAIRIDTHRQAAQYIEYARSNKSPKQLIKDIQRQ